MNCLWLGSPMTKKKNEEDKDQYKLSTYPSPTITLTLLTWGQNVGLGEG